MQTELFVREKQEFKKIAITNPAKPEIDKNILNKWQNIIDITADIIGVSSALIMKINHETMEVIIKNQNKNNPYRPGDSDSLGHGLYCETVIAKNESLYIKNALKNEIWRKNPDTDLNMISYYGLPLNWPDKEKFGTICILNDTPIRLNDNHKKLLKEFKKVIEEDLNLLLNQLELKNFFDVNLDLLCIANTDGEFVKVNRAWEDLLGYEAKELEGMKFLDFIHPNDLTSTKKVIEKLKKNQKVTNFINRYIDNAGNYHFIEWSSKVNGNHIYAAARDITNRKEQRAKLEFQYKFQKTLAEISSCLLEIDFSNIDRKLNESLHKMGIFFEVDRSYIFLFSDENRLMSNTHEWCRDSIESQKDNLQNIASEIFPWWMKKLLNNEHINIKNVSEMSQAAIVEQEVLKEQDIKSAVVMPMYINNKLFGFFGFDSVRKRIEFSKEEIRLLKIFTDLITNAFSKHIDNKRIRDLTYKDNLTGLYNRRFFEKELERLNTKRQLPISIITADINGLKIINDSLGHKKGDDLLIKSAELIKKVIRKEDILARYGGDEFVLLLPQTDEIEAEKIINRIRKRAKATELDELTVSIALGTASKTDLNQEIKDVLKKADNDMYQNKLSESRSIKNKIVQSLLKTLEVKSNETKEHAMRMTKLSFDFGNKLGLSNSELNRLSLLSTLHDIGKTTIEEKILKKPGKLTEKEWQIMKQHPERGYKIARASEEFALVAEEIYSHHERWDGKGYPRQLKGKEIPYLARIISIIDAYDVMTNERPYSNAMSIKDALEEIYNCAGTQFDPDLANLFIEVMKK